MKPEASEKLTSEVSSSQPEERHVLVIGGAGYIGSDLTRRLLAQGYKVRVLDLLMYGNGASISALMEEENFSFIQGDFGVQPTLDLALQGITDVVLLAALVGDPICKKYPDLAKKINLEYPKILFEKLVNKGLRTFIFSSTCSNYGLRPDETPATEESELNPQSLYAETKVEFEKYLLENRRQVDFSPVILRLATAFGISNRMRFDLTVSEFTRELALNKELMVYDEHTWRPYCHVSDISNAVIRVLEMPSEKVFGEVFNIGSDENNHTKKMIVEIIQSHTGAANVRYGAGSSDPRNYRVSFEKAENLLRFRAKVQVQDSVKQLIYCLRNGLFADVERNRNNYGNHELYF